MLFAFQLWFAVLGSSSPFAAVVIGLVLYNGSVLAEVVRAGIAAVPKGQTEAALAIGLSKTQLMTHRPAAAGADHDAARRGLPAGRVVKDTALGGILVGYVELRRAANTSASNYGNLLPTYVVVAVIYILINLLLSSLSTYLERKLRTARRAAGGRSSRPAARPTAGAPGDRGPRCAGGRRVQEVGAGRLSRRSRIDVSCATTCFRDRDEPDSPAGRALTGATATSSASAIETNGQQRRTCRWSPLLPVAATALAGHTDRTTRPSPCRLWGTSTAYPLLQSSSSGSFAPPASESRACRTTTRAPPTRLVRTGTRPCEASNRAVRCFRDRDKTDSSGGGSLGVSGRSRWPGTRGSR